MNNTTTATTTAMPGSLMGRTLTTLLVAVGPSLSVSFAIAKAGAAWLPSQALAPVLWAILVMWSPMPLSFPALLLQDARDAALPQYRGFIGSAIRATKLIGYLVTSKHSSVRVEMTASLIGFAGAILIALPHLG